MKRTLAVFTAALTILLTAQQYLVAHEGHDHDAAPPPTTATIAPRGEATSEAFELVAIAEGGELAIYLDRFADNEPVEGAAIEVETPDGPLMAQAELGKPYRIPAPWLAKPGSYDLIFTVTADNVADVLPVTLEVADPPMLAGAIESPLSTPAVLLLGGGAVGFLLGVILMVGIRRSTRNVAAVIVLVAAAAALAGTASAHEGEDHGTPAPPARPAGRDLAQRLPDGSIFIPKATQRILAIRTALTERARFQRTVELPGRIIPDPNASGLAQASVGGRLTPPSNGFPKLGAWVAKDDVLAYVTPPLQAIDVSDMRQKQGELDQQIAIVVQRVARYEALAPSGGIPRMQLDEARLELQGLKDRRAALDKARREPEALVAPVAGIIADGAPVAGQMAQPNTIVFQIVDPAKLWIEALSFDALVSGKTATGRTSSGRSLALTYQGSGFSDRNQSIPVHFAIEGDVGGVRVGQFVTVFAVTAEEQQGLAVPRTSVVRNANGQDVVYEHVTAERFQPRPVRIEPLDSERVLVAAGLDASKRVVIQGAELLDQVR